MIAGFGQVHLRKRLKSEPANHEMIAKPEIVLPFKIGNCSSYNIGLFIQDKFSLESRVLQARAVEFSAAFVVFVNFINL